MTRLREESSIREGKIKYDINKKRREKKGKCCAFRRRENDSCSKDALDPESTDKGL